MEVLVKPSFTEGFYNIPYALMKILGIPTSKAIKGYAEYTEKPVLFILVDGLRLDMFSKYMWELTRYGELTSLTSLFPSTTAAALTTLYTGLSPKEHGIIEWYMYYEKYGGIIKTLPFSPQDSKENDVLIKEGYDPELFNLPTISEQLAEKGISACHLLRAEYYQSAYTKNMLKKSKVISFNNLPEAFKLAKKVIEKCDFVSLYIDYLDIIEHKYGCDSAQAFTMVNKIKKEISEIIKSHSDISVVVTSDHGHIKLDRKIVINNARNNVMIGGSPRDLFLYSDVKINLNPDFFIELSSETAINEYLGPGMEHPSLRNRIGKKIILPDKGIGLWHKLIIQKSFHGGLTREEMFIPFYIKI